MYSLNSFSCLLLRAGEPASMTQQTRWGDLVNTLKNFDATWIWDGGMNRKPVCHLYRAQTRMSLSSLCSLAAQEEEGGETFLLIFPTHFPWLRQTERAQALKILARWPGVYSGSDKNHSSGDSLTLRTKTGETSSNKKWQSLDRRVQHQHSHIFLSSWRSSFSVHEVTLKNPITNRQGDFMCCLW